MGERPSLIDARLRELAEQSQAGGHTSWTTERGEVVPEEQYLALVDDHAEMGRLILDVMAWLVDSEFMAAQGALVARLSAEDIIGTLAEDPSTVEYLNALATEYEALLRHCRPVDIESARRRHGE